VGGNYQSLHFGYTNANDTVKFGFWGDDILTLGTYSDLVNFEYWTGSYNTATNERIIYKDGDPENSDTTSGDLNTTGNLEIGCYLQVGGRYWDGIIDEVRVESVTRSPNWIKLCYENQKPGQSLVKLDLTMPTLTGFTLTSGNPTSNPDITFFLAGNDDVLITGWMINESSTKPGAGDAGWTGSKPTDYTLTGGFGLNTVYAWAKDASGKVSDSLSFAVDYTATPPPFIVSVTATSVTGVRVTFSENVDQTTAETPG
ncbi:MAG: LamG domain-containing protein, partial [Planctomycetes bacterium]|nr:LamG domain-containing protein [Planctomycetota bacterium]